ncbi:hypothetical protein HPB49_006171 [Dermacentor silvarum]|uniref:Uncharacterized protein n=1 Tax=Dermacentor silvarum TaxID=543639 RepID=A0ACB8CJL4_DERSI|nr:hypothetical protein HPB49_006171 [Dermacentor silvarum]
MSAKVDSANRPGGGISQNRPNAGALFRTQDNGDKLKRKIIRASWMPPMPNEHAKIIIRPRGGLNIAKTGPTVIDNASKYARIRALHVAERMFEVSAYEAAPHTTCKWIIRHIDLNDSPSDLERNIVDERNPLALAGSLRIPASRQSSPVQVLLEVQLQGSPTRVPADLGRPSSRNAGKGNPGLTARA